MKIIIIGGVAGGATTAARIRRSDETAEIILLEKGKYIWFLDKLQDSISKANCDTGAYTIPVSSQYNKQHTAKSNASAPRQSNNLQVRSDKSECHSYSTEYKLSCS